MFNDERITTTEYAYNLDDWLIRHPARQELSDLEGNIISRSEMYYDDETFAGDNLGEVAKGNATFTKNWVTPDDPDDFVLGQRTLSDCINRRLSIECMCVEGL